MPTIELADEEGVQSSGIKFLDQKIFENSFSEIGHYRYEPFVLILRDDHQNASGGLHGRTGLGWLYIDVLWVAEENRAKGFGTQLMRAAEKEAVRRGCHSSYLYTYSFQQPEFYEKLGYEVFGRLDDFPDGHAKYFMKKSLEAEKSEPR
jgi:GNAT superfamily N-acetyltransferase